MSGGYLNIDTEQSRISITVKKFAASAISTQQGCIKFIKSDSKDIYNVTKD